MVRAKFRELCLERGSCCLFCESVSNSFCLESLKKAGGFLDGCRAVAGLLFTDVLL